MRCRAALLVVVVGCGRDPSNATPADVGALIFADTTLSQPAGQSCADCHAAGTAFSDPEDDRSSAGAIRDRFGVRNAQSAAYASFVPPLARDPATGRARGGLFWDGRADTLEAQAGFPLLNPLEMNNPSKASVVERLRRAPYADELRDVFGADALDDVDRGFAHAGEAIAAFERSTGFAPFSSKYDRFLAGTAQLAPSEARGLAIFEDPTRGNCASCHPSEPGPDGAPPLFTDFSYANLGLPRFGNSMFYALPPDLNPEGDRYIDHGLAKTTGDPAHDGMFRVPSLRNVARTGPYGHNGYFRTLPEMIDFLDTRDTGSVNTSGTCRRVSGAPRIPCPWPAPEVPATVERQRTGHLGLRADEIDDLLAFLTTLSDGS